MVPVTTLAPGSRIRPPSLGEVGTQPALTRRRPVGFFTGQRISMTWELDPDSGPYRGRRRSRSFVSRLRPAPSCRNWWRPASAKTSWCARVLAGVVEGKGLPTEGDGGRGGCVIADNPDVVAEILFHLWPFN